MNIEQMHRITAERTKKKFGSHKILYGKYTPQYPESVQREYTRAVNAYMRILKEEIEKALPELKEAYKPSRDEEVAARMDSATDFIMALNLVIAKIRNALVERTSGFGLRRKLEALAHMTRKLTIKEWKQMIKATLGIDIREDYYMGEMYTEYLRTWVDQNVGLISTIPEDTLNRMRDIIYQCFTEGRTLTRMMKEIQKEYRITRRHAQLIARDQTSKLNGQIQRAQQVDAGITEYIWTTSRDERVRKSHRELEGKKFSWDDPPENSDGRKCHPGEDYQCRCIGRPVMDWEKLTLPVAEEQETGGGRGG